LKGKERVGGLTFHRRSIDGMASNGLNPDRWRSTFLGFRQ